MVFPSLPSNYLDPTTHQWQQQQQQQMTEGISHESGGCFQLVSPPRAVPQVRPGSMTDRVQMPNLAAPETALKCPRCESTNTKFCYFNNYSLSQPRHFCKTCRRYWTRGGALRTVPVGGGYRRNNKRTKTTSKSPANSHCQSSSTTTTAPEFSAGEAMRLNYNVISTPNEGSGIANFLGFDQIQWRPQLHQMQPSPSLLGNSSAWLLGNNNGDASSSYNMVGEIQKKIEAAKMEEDLHGQEQANVEKQFWGVVGGSDGHYWSGLINPNNSSSSHSQI